MTRLFSRSFVFLFLLLFFLLISQFVFAAQVKLAWDANTESDLAGYKVYYGTGSKSYTGSVDVGNVTSYTVTGLTQGQTYYVTITAYNSSGSESGYSTEVSGVATETAPVVSETPPTVTPSPSPEPTTEPETPSQTPSQTTQSSSSSTDNETRKNVGGCTRESRASNSGSEVHRDSSLYGGI